MNIKGIASQTAISFYNKNVNKVKNSEAIVKTGDTIEISNLGKSLKDFSLDGINIDNTSKIAEIKSKIEIGTYNVDAKLTAKSIVDYIKENK